MTGYSTGIYHEKKIARFKNHLTFNLRCLHRHILPHDLCLISPVRSMGATKILLNACFRLLRERVSITRKILNRHILRAEQLEMTLQGTLNPPDFIRIMSLCNNSFKNVFLYTKSKQIKKFNRLVPSKTSTHSRPSSASNSASNSVSTNRWVVNLTDEDITEQEYSLLKKGLNFAITPDRFHFDDFISPIESSLQQLPSNVADSVRSSICHVLKKATIPHCNLESSERRALVSLKRKKHLMILPADKGRSTVIMKTTDYEEKASHLLSEGPYVRFLCSTVYQKSISLKFPSVPLSLLTIQSLIKLPNSSPTFFPHYVAITTITSKTQCISRILSTMSGYPVQK